jgi:hypothetical protein
MAKNKTKKRLRKAARKLEKQRREAAHRHPFDLGFGQGFPDLPPPPWDDPEGGAGVREPRRPRPSMPAGALALEEPRSTYLDLVG